MSETKDIEEHIDILIIEDNESDIELIELFLFKSEFFEFQLSSASTFQDGLKIYKKKRFDIVLLDLSLPDATDQETIELALEKLRNTPIIILTGKNDERFARKTIKEGIQDYLVKGNFDSRQLIKAINYAIDRYKMLSANQDLTFKVKKQQKKLRKIIDKIPESVLIMSDDGIVKFVNPATEALFGIKKRIFIGNKLEMLHLERKDGTMEIIQPNGEKKLAEINSVNIQWERENAHLLTLRDVSERLLYQQKIKDSEKKYRELFNNSPYPIAIMKKSGELLDVNSKLENLIEYNKDDIIGLKYISKNIFEAPRPRYFQEIVEDLTKRRKNRPIQLRINTKNDKTKWIELDFSIIEIEHEILIYIIVHDITKLVNSEREIKKLEKIMHEMNALIEHAPLAILLIHQSGKVLRVNEMAKDLFGISETEFLSSNVFNLLNSKKRNKIEEHYRNDIYDLSNSNKIEANVTTSTGEVRDVEITSTILKIADNIIIQSFISDITRRKLFETNRKLFLDQLQTSLEFKSKFLATISHELRTPLNAILGFSEILMEDDYGQLKKEQRGFIEDIHSAGNHLLTLINSILDLSKMETGNFKLNISQFNLNKLMKEILSIINPLYSKKNIELTIEGINDDDCIIADRFRFKQILFNLISNAIKFTKKGSVTIKVIEKINYWEFQIKDTGIGIDKQDYGVIFREFSRVDNSIVNEIPGVGLGLALTKRLVEFHGGKIWFKSEKHEGSTFSFTIPFLTINEEKNNINKV